MYSRNFYSRNTFSSSGIGIIVLKNEDSVAPNFSEETVVLSYSDSQDNIIPALEEFDGKVHSYIIASDSFQVIISSEVYDIFIKRARSSSDTMDVSLSELVVFGSFHTMVNQDELNIELDDTSIFDSDIAFSSFDILTPELEYDTASPLKGALIRLYRQDIYELIKNHLITDYYEEDEELDVFIRLIARMFGELKYYSEYFPELLDIEKCSEDFLPHLANFYGYDIPEGVVVREIRLILRYFLSIRRRRGTEESVLNAARFAGREEFGYLNLEEGIGVRIEELNKLGLIYVDGSNINVSEVIRSINETKPAGVKIAYAIRHSIPRWIKTRKFSMAFTAEFEPKIIDLPITLTEDTDLSNTLSHSEIFSDFLSEEISSYSVFSDDDIFNLSYKSDINISLYGTGSYGTTSYSGIYTEPTLLENSNVIRSGLGVYGTQVYGNTRYSG